jgi:hypothetical protein
MSEQPELIAALDLIDRSIDLCAIAEDRNVAEALQARIALAHQHVDACVAKLVAPTAPPEPALEAPPLAVAAFRESPSPAAGTLAEGAGPQVTLH